MNILIFGPNGSGKGTQGNLIKQKYNLAHIESGAIFREHIGGGTELGKKAKAYIDRGDLVPDDITIPMVLETLKTKGKDGWLLDGFPRNMVQAEKLWDALQKEGLKLDYVVEILLPREVAKNRIMGRPTISLLTPSSRTATNVACAGRSFPPAATIRTRRPSTSAMIFTTTLWTAPWPRPISSRIWPARARQSILNSTARAALIPSRKPCFPNWTECRQI